MPSIITEVMRCLTPCEELTAMKSYIRRLQIICNEKEKNRLSFTTRSRSRKIRFPLPAGMERVPGYSRNPTTSGE
ncbi:hypothetical protein TNCV_421221 [Trichonephila clavipes]|nr:hypothetical protein TNCV_421221 [Trichonephila clavipes]